MTQWEYSIAAYSRNKRLEPLTPVIQPGAEMAEMNQGDCLHVSTFLRKAGELGWELTSSLVPYPVGMRLSEGEDSDARRDFTVRDSGEIQWMIFKRPR
jgi:hypothetical protein